MNGKDQSAPLQTEQFPLLFSPFRIRGVELRNRFVFQPHFTALGTVEGQPTDAHVAYHEERARGGVGLIIIESQAIAFTLADRKLEIDAARLLVWRAALMGRNGHDFDNAEGSMSKLKAGEVAVWATERAIHILGGTGYSREYPVERMHRDSKI